MSARDFGKGVVISASLKPGGKPVASALQRSIMQTHQLSHVSPWTSWNTYNVDTRSASSAASSHGGSRNVLFLRKGVLDGLDRNVKDGIWWRPADTASLVCQRRISGHDSPNSDPSEEPAWKSALQEIYPILTLAKSLAVSTVLHS